MASEPLFQRASQFGIAMPHLVVAANHREFAASFLRIVHAASCDDAPITREEMLYIRDNMRIITMCSVKCFCDEVQSFEFPTLVRIPVSSIAPTGDKKIIVIMCHFELASGGLDCYYYGFQFNDDLGLRAHAPTGDDVFITPGVLRSVFDLLVSIRERALASTRECSPTTNLMQPTSAVSATPSTDIEDLRSSVDVLLSANQIASEHSVESGAYIFCSLARGGPVYGASCSKEQVVGRIKARLWHYKAAAGLNKKTRGRLAGVLSASCANDLAHEFVVVLALMVAFKHRADYLVESELALMRLRIENKLTDHPTRIKFLELNDMLDAYTAHQATCAHEKHACFSLFVQETYRATLARVRRTVDYLMYGIPDEQMRNSDKEMIELLTWLAEQTGAFIRDQMK